MKRQGLEVSGVIALVGVVAAVAQVSTLRAQAPPEVRDRGGR